MNDSFQTPGLSARQTAVIWLGQCLHQHRPLDEVMQDHKSVPALESRDRNLARLIVLTTLRRLIEIDQILSAFLNRGFPRKSGNLREILQISVAQLLFLEIPAHAVVDCAIKLAKKDRNARHLKNLANGVLRNIARQGQELTATEEAGRINTPEWLWNAWTASYGEAPAAAIAAMHLEQAPLDLTVKQDPEGWADRLEGELLPTGSVRLTRAGAIPDLPGFSEGAWWVQDAAAAIPSRLFDKVKNKQVVDLCAAPGGKTAQLAHAGAHLTSVDISKPRLNRLRENLERLQLRSELITADALNWSPGKTFDAVLLDAPCSSTGTIRRHPDVQRLKQPDMIKSLIPIQDQLLDKAYSLLKPGGQLVYCVCSLQSAEGADRIEAFLERHQDMVRKDIRPEQFGLPLTARTKTGDLQLRPDMLAGQGGMDGFFITVMNRQV